MDADSRSRAAEAEGDARWDRRSSRRSPRRTWPRGRRARPLRAGDFLSIRPRHVMTHDNTAPVMKKFQAIGAHADPRPAAAGLRPGPRHPEPLRGEPGQVPRDRGVRPRAGRRLLSGRDRASATRSWSSSGTWCPGPSSSPPTRTPTCTAALGAVGTPVVRTDAAAIWATGEFWWQIPRTVQVVLEGALPAGVDRQGRDPRPVRALQPGRGAERRGRVRRARGRDALPGRAPDHRQHDHRVGRAGRLVPGRRGRRSTYLRRAPGASSPSGDRPRQDERPRGLGREPAGARTPMPSYAARIALDLAAVTPHVSGPDTVQVTPPRSPRSSRGRSRSTRPTSSPASTRGSRTSAAAAARAAGQEGRRRGRALRRRGEPRRPGGGRAARGLAGAARRRRHDRCRRAAGPASASATGPARAGRGRHLGDQPQLQGSHGIAGRAVLPGQPRGRRRVGRGRLHRGPGRARWRGTASARAPHRAIRPTPGRVRRDASRSSPAFPSS